MKVKLPTLTPVQANLLVLGTAVVTSLVVGHSGVLGATDDQISTNDPFANDADTTLSGITSPSQLVFMIINFLRWLGWAGVLVGVALALFGLIYKLMNEDNEKTMKTVQGYITKAVVIVVAGVLLVSAGFIIKSVAALFGLQIGDNVFEPVSDTLGG